MKHRIAGGNKLVVVQEVHWNTIADCLSACMKNWSTLVSICEENCINIDSVVQNKVTNFWNQTEI